MPQKHTLWLSEPDIEKEDAELIERLKHGDYYTTCQEQALRLSRLGYDVKHKVRHIVAGEVITTDIPLEILVSNKEEGINVSFHGDPDLCGYGRFKACSASDGCDRPADANEGLGGGSEAQESRNQLFVQFAYEDTNSSVMQTATSITEVNKNSYLFDGCPWYKYDIDGETLINESGSFYIKFKTYK